MTTYLVTGLRLWLTSYLLLRVSVVRVNKSYFTLILTGFKRVGWEAAKKYHETYESITDTNDKVRMRNINPYPYATSKHHIHIRWSSCGR